jgi:hypothetical protein
MQKDNLKHDKPNYANKNIIKNNQTQIAYSECYRLSFLSGKIRTSRTQNISLQKFFIENGYKFLNGSTGIKEHEHLDYFFFENGIISLGAKSNVYNNRNPFNLKTWDGEVNFKNKKLKEKCVDDFLGFR